MLWVFCGEQRLFSRLRSPKTGQAHGTVAVLNFLVKRLRAAFPDVQIIFRGDAGFYGPKLLDCCERNDLKYIVGFSSNPLLKQKASNYTTNPKDRCYNSRCQQDQERSDCPAVCYTRSGSSYAIPSRWVFASEMFFVEGGSSEPFRIFGDLNDRAKTWRKIEYC